MTLRSRLLIAFLALALIPIAVLTFFALDRLDRSLALWNTPGVDRALDSALQSSKASLARLEAAVSAETDQWAATLQTEPLTPARRAEIETGLQSDGLDLLQIYRREGARWRLVEEVRPTGVLAVTRLDLSAELGAPDAGRLLHSPQGVLAGVVPLKEGEALVVGMLLYPGYFADLSRVGEGVGYYRRFGVVRDVSRAYIWLLVVVLFTILSLTALWASAILARGMTRPLSRLEDTVERVAAGDLSARVRPEGAREVVALGRRFNAMIERLATAQDALRQAEREAAWREVARRLAHEFKNILTPMSLSLHRLGRRTDQVADPHRSAVAESLTALSQGVEQMSRLAEQFSRYARLPEPRPERLDLDRLVRDAVKLHEHEGVSVRITSAGEPTWIVGDSLLLARAIHNLVLNACEATEGGGEVEVRSASEGEHAVVEVLDRGSGLAPEVRERLFEPYVSNKRRGSGLGLSLVRDIATQHRGTIALEDREGGGVRARLVIPAADHTNQDGTE